jgi:hypothetical protein
MADKQARSVHRLSRYIRVWNGADLGGPRGRAHLLYSATFQARLNRYSFVDPSGRRETTLSYTTPRIEYGIREVNLVFSFHVSGTSDEQSCIQLQ